MHSSIEDLDPKQFILIKGARVHNLKNIDLAIPRNQFVVITGLSGSGKSSLAFSTLYAEGQRRYVESLSSYARQFLGKVEKPDVDYIKGVAPAIAIEQKVSSTNSRSTVGTTTEIYDYLKLLYARLGKTFSPKSGKEVKRDSIVDILNYIQNLAQVSRVYLLAKKEWREPKSKEKELDLLNQQGFSRLWAEGRTLLIEDILESGEYPKELVLIIDRFVINETFDEESGRLSDSVETALYEGNQSCIVISETNGESTLKEFSTAFEEEGIEFMEPSVHLFSFNNPLGACPRCEGFGKVIGIDEDLVIPNKTLSIYEDAIAPWKGDKLSIWKKRLINAAEQFDFPIHKPIAELSEEQYELLWSGNKFFKGLDAFFEKLAAKSYKIQYRVMLARYRGRTKCPECKGSRLRKESSWVKIGNRSINELVGLPIYELKEFFDQLVLEPKEQEIAKRLLIEINNRIDYLLRVGVGYLSLNRPANTLSGGESQRINLATSLGSSLVGSLYILDEPSIGLHPKDTERLIGILKSLRDLGNTVIVVEHDEDIIKAADTVIDLGPEAGAHGGELVFQGTVEELKKSETLTAKYIRNELQIEGGSKHQLSKNFIELFGARENNLKGIDIKFPLNALSAVSGVSGSGKSTLIKKVLYPALQKHLGEYGEKGGSFLKLEGALKMIDEIQFIDQNPIGKSSRSNPVTYIKAYDEIRNLFSSLPLAKKRAYKPAFFSFNVDGGRCEVCQGEGEIMEEMQFMADIHLVCEECEGKRFKDEILEIKFQGKSIADVLDLTVEEALAFFGSQEDKAAQKVAERIQPLMDVGLSYVKLGQASGTLSGGEAQRIKLASYLGKGGSKNHILFIFDEPTTGLHFHDISKLMISFNALIDKGHTIIVIEHNPEVLKRADWLIDLGPEGGKKGGELLYQGEVEGIQQAKRSLTAEYLF